MPEEVAGMGAEWADDLLARLTESGLLDDGAGVVIFVWPERDTGGVSYTNAAVSAEGLFVEGLYRVLAAGPSEAFLSALADAHLKLERE